MAVVGDEVRSFSNYYFFRLVLIFLGRYGGGGRGGRGGGRYGGGGYDHGYGGRGGGGGDRW